MLQLLPRHVRVRPAIGRDDPFIGLRAVVDDGPDQIKIAVITAADHEYSGSFAWNRTIRAAR